MTKQNVKTRVHIRRKHPIVVSEDHVRKLFALLATHIGDTTVSAQCSDDVVREFVDCEGLCLYENPPTKRITQLSLAAKSGDFKRYADIDIIGNGIRIVIVGPEQMSLSLKDSISDITDGMKPWHSIFPRIDTFYVIMSIAVIFLVFASALPGRQGQPELDIDQVVAFTAISVLVILSIILVFWGIGRGINRLTKRFFPAVYFALGQNVEGYKADDKIRWTIVAGTITLLISLAIALPLRFIN